VDWDSTPGPPAFEDDAAEEVPLFNTQRRVLTLAFRGHALDVLGLRGSVEVHYADG